MLALTAVMTLISLLAGRRMHHNGVRAQSNGQSERGLVRFSQALIIASSDAIYDAHTVSMEAWPVRTTIALDDELVAKAQELTGIAEKAALMRAALAALVERESARRLARLGGSEPDLWDVPRRRSKAA
jgi:Arc/MetJ family transcription regulator